MSQMQSEWNLSMKKGMDHCRKNQFDLAKVAFSDAAQLQPNRYESWLNLCTVCLALGDSNQALAAAMNAMKISPNNNIVQMMVGDACRECNRPEDALVAYQKSVQLERSVLALNKLGCSVRENKSIDEARLLFEEVLEKSPKFSMARYNLMVTNVMLRNMVEVKKHHHLLQPQDLPPKEMKATKDMAGALQEYQRLDRSLTLAPKENTLDALDDCLMRTESFFPSVDEGLIAHLKLIACALNDTVMQGVSESYQAHFSLPQDWDTIESLYMIPLLSGAKEYYSFHEPSITDPQKKSEVTESLAMLSAISHARTHKERMLQPYLAESSIRFWHLLSTQNLDGFISGHFKMWPNELADDVVKTRTDVDKTPSTVRTFLRDIYPTVTPGLPRAILALYMLVEVHPFSDGNGRVAMAWMNRELEWNGEFPALYTRKMGLRGELMTARIALREDPRDIQPLIDAIRAGQGYAMGFCEELALLRAGKGF